MAKIFFGSALADSMFAGVGACCITRHPLTVVEVVTKVAGGVVSCCNPSHQATIDAMRSRFGLHVEIPQSPPRATLARYDSVIVMGVRGLPRLTDRHEYTTEEVTQATFEFSEYTVDGQIPLPQGFEDSLASINRG